MSKHHQILGVPPTATAEEVKAAYRKLASKWHPDKAPAEKKLEHEAEFKKIKAAYEAIESGAASGFKESGWGSDAEQRVYEQFWEKREWPGGASDTFREFAGVPPRNEHCEISVNVGAKQAAEGFVTTVIFRDGTSAAVVLPPGLPHGFVYVTHATKVNGQRARVDVRVNIQEPDMEFDSFEKAPYEMRTVRETQKEVLVLTGNVTRTVTVDALDVVLGSWLTVKDHLGKEVQVRLPAGFNVAQRMRVKGHGYNHWWAGGRAGDRGDLFIKVDPLFKPIRLLDKDKVAELYRQVVGGPISEKV